MLGEFINKEASPSGRGGQITIGDHHLEVEDSEVCALDEMVRAVNKSVGENEARAIASNEEFRGGVRMSIQCRVLRLSR